MPVAGLLEQREAEKQRWLDPLFSDWAHTHLANYALGGLWHRRLVREKVRSQIGFRDVAKSLTKNGLQVPLSTSLCATMVSV